MSELSSLLVFYYQKADGRQPFVEWLDQLRADRRARAAIQVRIDRIERGLAGDWKSVGGGVFEIRIDYGPGYRIYFGRDGQRLVVLLSGGDKGSQRYDINVAKTFWRDYEKRKSSGGGAA
jgi:putative addiction module killer protein